MTIAIGAAVMEYIQPIAEPVIKQFIEMGGQVAEFIPIFAIGLVTLIILLMVAGILRFVISNVCKKLKLDSLAEKVGLSQTLGRLGITAPLSKVLSKIVYWMIALFAIKAAADIWGVADISNAVNGLITFLPRLFVAIFILFAGIMAADLVRNAVKNGLDNYGIEYGGMIGNIIYGLIAVMILTVVLGQIGIQTDLLNATVKILLGAVALAVALSLGLGLRSVAQNVVSGVYTRDLFPPGSILEVEGSTAVVQEVGAVATRLVAEDGQFFVIPNSTLVNQVNRGITKVNQEYIEKV